MAAAQFQAVQRQEEIRVCRDAERGHASRTCQENHQASVFPFRI